MHWIPQPIFYGDKVPKGTCLYFDKLYFLYKTPKISELYKS